MKYFPFITLLYFAINHNLMAQSVEIDDSSVIQSYLIQVDDNTLLKGKIIELNADSIFLKLELLGNINISRKSNFIVEIMGGSTFRGELLEISNDSLLFDMTGLTNVWIKNTDVVKLTVLEWQDIGTEGYSIANQHKTRYLFSPSGYSLGEGNGYYQNIYGVINAVNYGVSENISIGFGADFVSLLNEGTPSVFITPKIGKKYNDNTYLGGGLLIGSLGIFDPNNPFIVLGYGVVTRGTENRNLTLAIGHSYGNKSLTSHVITLNAYSRISNRYGFVSENWLMKETAILAYGLRKFDKRISTDFGIAFISVKMNDAFDDSYRVAFPLPYLGWVINW